MNIKKTELKDAIEGIDHAMAMLKVSKRILISALLPKTIKNSKPKILRQIAVDVFKAIEDENAERIAFDTGETDAEFSNRMQSMFTVRPFHALEIIKGKFKITDCIDYKKTPKIGDK